MALMTHAPARLEANYRTLSTDDQDRFDHAMELADNTADNGEYVALMLAAASIAGLRIPYGTEIRRCGCSCWCPTIFDAADPDAHVIEPGDGYNLGRHQCPWCADQHRETA
ncbi:hypothetical protein SAM23877_p065 (plasmid) [Streptomyces ambofaciens ATCC 23877]|uniref:Uncharacterized protein n=1 Tax=Streptomyces ambofaciens (strain ATCC 23877 / 3486 / DSM 40053 / JCM 4204 / NBRC 12836 / NRRL B-2516) TaxID=278992 RepID=A0A0K2B669_STRA7|nr:hypothetical protein [Streptomyces ambofaciens]AKZ60774.1 hypothetical protein SAM23877_p065 [Streptomyces ambofaciens ATCC 23877]